MSWTTITGSSQTWTPTSGAATTWNAQTIAVVPPPWGLLSSITSAVDEGVDFRLTLHNEAPWYLHSDRPVILQNIQPEG